MKQFAVFFCLVLFAASPATGLASVPSIQDLDKAGKFAEALAQVEQTPNYDANYFYNLGILRGKLNQNDLAVAYLEKANRLSPHDPEVIQNLRLARSKLARELGVASTDSGIDFTSTRIEQFADKIHLDEILGIIGLVVFGVSLFWMRAYWKTRSLLKTFLKPSGWFGAFGLMISFALYGIHQSGKSDPPAVLVMSQPLRSGPGLSYPEITKLRPGVKVRLIGVAVTVNENELWQKIRYKGDQAAWVPLSGLLAL